MSLRVLLQSFYTDVQDCVSGKKRDRDELAWEIVNLAIESTQDGGTFFTIEEDEESTATIDTRKLEIVLDRYDMNTVTWEAKRESVAK